jgi:hypothetical protein
MICTKSSGSLHDPHQRQRGEGFLFEGGQPAAQGAESVAIHSGSGSPLMTRFLKSA